MATALVQEFKIAGDDRTTTNYDHLMKTLALDGSPPPGLIVHTAGWDETSGVFRIFAVWESAEQAGTFIRDRVRPVLEEALPNPDRSDAPDLESMYDLHHFVDRSSGPPI